MTLLAMGIYDLVSPGFSDMNLRRTGSFPACLPRLPFRRCFERATPSRPCMTSGQQEGLAVTSNPRDMLRPTPSLACATSGCRPRVASRLRLVRSLSTAPLHQVTYTPTEAREIAAWAWQPRLLQLSLLSHREKKGYGHTDAFLNNASC